MTGRDKLIRTTPSSILVTNSGYTILQALKLSHPFGKFILNAVQIHTERYGDGACTFIIYLASALRALLSCTSKYSIHHPFPLVKALKYVMKLVEEDGVEGRRGLQAVSTGGL